MCSFLITTILKTKKWIAIGLRFNSKPVKGAEAGLVSGRQHPLRAMKQQSGFYFSFRSITVHPACLKEAKPPKLFVLVHVGGKNNSQSQVTLKVTCS